MIDIAGAKELNRAFWFDALASLLAERVRSGDSDPDTDRALTLARIAQRVLALDAEDFATLAGDAKDYPWASELVECAFPSQPRARRRGALTSLVPLFGLMLEIVELRATRDELQTLVMVAHLMSEYLCQLAWEPVLGHAGDPARMSVVVADKWGTDDRDCPHSSASKATAKRVLAAANGGVEEWAGYLDRFHSRLGVALAQCAMNTETVAPRDRPESGPLCHQPCPWVLERWPVDVRKDLDARCRLALLFAESPLVALRHHSPVGHFFGVPGLREVKEAWRESWSRLTDQWDDRTNPLAGRRFPGGPGPLPGLESVISVIAGRPIAAGTLLHDIQADIASSLDKIWDTAPRG